MRIPLDELMKMLNQHARAGCRQCSTTYWNLNNHRGDLKAAGTKFSMYPSNKRRLEVVARKRVLDDNRDEAVKHLEAEHA